MAVARARHVFTVYRHLNRILTVFTSMVEAQTVNA